MFWSRFKTINLFKTWFWHDFFHIWNILSIIVWKHYCYWNQTFWVWSRFKCIINVKPSISFHRSLTHMKIKGLCQVSDFTLRETKGFTAYIRVLKLQLNESANTKVRKCWRHKVLIALQLCVQEVAKIFFHVLPVWIMSMNHDSSTFLFVTEFI